MIDERSVKVAADLARIARCRGNAGEGGQRVGGIELVQASADGGEKLRPQHGADAGDAQEDVGELVLAKPALNELVHLADPLVEGHHLLGHGADQLGDGLLPGNAGGRCCQIPISSRFTKT